MYDIRVRQGKCLFENVFFSLRILAESRSNISCLTVSFQDYFYDNIKKRENFMIFMVL